MLLNNTALLHRESGLRAFSIINEISFCNNLIVAFKIPSSSSIGARH